MLKIQIFLLSTMSLLSCSKKITTDKITKIEIATGYCNGECPFTATRIDSSLRIEFYGGTYADKKGYYTGYLKRFDWNDLTKLLNSINYKNLDSCYQKTTDDQQLELIVTNNGKSKHILAQEKSLPKSVAKAFYKIATSYTNAINFKPSSDSIPFDTKIQYLQKINSPKFPPKTYK